MHHDYKDMKSVVDKLYEIMHSSMQHSYQPGITIFEAKYYLYYENDIDKPTVNYKIDMINLANTTAYKDFKMLVEVNKGDTVTCYIKHLDIDVKARVIDYERDLITGEYTSIELGNAVSNFFNKQADIQSQVDNILNDNGSVNAGTVEGAINAIKTQFFLT